MATGELACTYAALILHDDGIDVTAEKISTLVNAANLNIESYWPSLFAKLCQNKNIDDLIMNAGAGGYAAAPTAVSSSDSAPEEPLKLPQQLKRKRRKRLRKRVMMILYPACLTKKP